MTKISEIAILETTKISEIAAQKGMIMHITTTKLKKDEILLKQVITGEYAPRYYILFGASFDELLEKVQALPREQRTWIDRETAWHVNNTALAALKAQELTITRVKDIYMEVVEETLEDNAISLTFDVAFNYRCKDGEMKRHPQISEAAWTLVPLTIAYDEADVQAQVAKSQYNNSKYAMLYGKKGVLNRMAREAAEVLQTEVRAVWNQHIGKRTPDERKAALDAVKAFLTQKRGE